MKASLARLLASVASVLALRGQGEFAELLRTVAVVVRESSEASKELTELTLEIERLARAGVDPSPEQILAVSQRRAALAKEVADVVIAEDDQNV